jgi:hypothetical protein
MSCFKPLKAFKSQEVNLATGKHLITFNPMKALIQGSSLKLPCGQCIGCRSHRAAEWAIRCHHEAKMHERNCFLTLTYDDLYVPRSYSVDVRPWQLFMKRLRYEIGHPVRYLASGEYSDAPKLRPHFHAVLFGFDPPDKVRWSTSNGFPTFKSELIERLWPYGLHELGSVTLQSSGYVARYCLKKITGKPADDHYFRVSPIDGELHRVGPEWATMSLKPGIGATWFDRFAGDAFPSDFLIVDGQRVAVPRYYVSKLAEHEEKLLKRDRLRREFGDLPARRRRAADNTPERLAVREEVQSLRGKRLVRSL